MNAKRRAVLGGLALLTRLMGFVLDRWLLVLIAVFFISPVGPHLRWTYTYTETYGQRSYLQCSYFGSRGIVLPTMAGDCPLLIILDARKGRR